jgi:ABC-type lipoprotein export system ATPase subunit
MLDEYKTKPLTKDSLFLINGNHYIVGAVGSGKTTLLSKLIVIYH